MTQTVLATSQILDLTVHWKTATKVTDGGRFRAFSTPFGLIVLMSLLTDPCNIYGGVPDPNFDPNDIGHDKLLTVDEVALFIAEKMEQDPVFRARMEFMNTESEEDDSDLSDLPEGSGIYSSGATSMVVKLLELRSTDEAMWITEAANVVYNTYATSCFFRFTPNPADPDDEEQHDLTQVRESEVINMLNMTKEQLYERI